MYLYFQEQEQTRYKLIKEHTKKTVLLGSEKKRSAVSDRPRVKRTKSLKQKTPTIQPPVQLDVKPLIKLEEVHNIPIKLEHVKSESSCISHIKEEVLQDVPSPLQLSPPQSPSLPSPPSSLPLSPSPTTSLPQSQPPTQPSLSSQFSPPISSPPLPPHVPIQEYMEQESINAITIEPCNFSNALLLKIKEENTPTHETIKLEPVSLTADEIRKAEEGQAAAAMLLEQMSGIEEKYNPPLTPSPPPLPLPSPPLPSELQSEDIVEPKFSPPNYLIKREFHPEDMLTTTVQSIITE